MSIEESMEITLNTGLRFFYHSNTEEIRHLV